MHYGMTVLTLY